MEGTDIKAVAVPQTKYAGPTGSDSSTDYKMCWREIELLASFASIIRYS